MANAKHDDNRVPSLIAVSSVDGETPVRLWADPTTHRLLVANTFSPADIVFDTTDANAGMLKVLLPDGDATNVPVLMVGRESIIGSTDLGILDGITQASLVIYGDAAGDTIRLYHDGTRPRYISGSGAHCFGTGTPGSIASEDGDDAYITGQLEVDGNLYADAQVRVLNSSIWVGIGVSSGLQFSGTAATRAGIIYGTDQGMSLVAGSLDGHGNHQVNIISGDNVLKDHDRDTKATNPRLNIFSATDPDSDNTQYGYFEHDTSDFIAGAATGGFKMDGIRLKQAKGANVASAGDLTLGEDGNYFIITGTTNINAITTAGWEAGTDFFLEFAGILDVNHNTSGGAGTAEILIDTSSTYTSAAGSILHVVYNGTNFKTTPFFTP